MGMFNLRPGADYRYAGKNTGKVYQEMLAESAGDGQRNPPFLRRGFRVDLFMLSSYSSSLHDHGRTEVRPLFHVFVPILTN